MDRHDMVRLLFNSDYEGMAMALEAAGRLVPPDVDTRTETATIFGGKTSQRVVRTLADGWTLAGPWVPVPTTKETP